MHMPFIPGHDDDCLLWSLRGRVPISQNKLSFIFFLILLYYTPSRISALSSGVHGHVKFFFSHTEAAAAALTGLLDSTASELSSVRSKFSGGLSKFLNHGKKTPSRGRASVRVS